MGGLHLDTTNETLRGYFEQYGQVLDAVVMRDGATRKSRGFGFVTLSDTKDVEKCLCYPHTLDGKEVWDLWWEIIMGSVARLVCIN